MTYEEQKKMMRIEDGVFLIVTSPENRPFLTGTFETEIGIVIGDRVIFKDGEWEDLSELMDYQVNAPESMYPTQLINPFCNQIIAVLEPFGGFTYAENRYKEQDLKFIRWRQDDAIFAEECYKRRKESEL